MNAQALIDIIRSDYLYDVSEPYRWSDAFLLRSILEAERQACNRWHLIYDDSTTTIAKIELKDGVQNYALSQKINAIESIRLNSQPVEKKSKHELEEFDPTWRTQTGVKNVPVRCVIRGRTISFIPIPTASKDATYIQSTAPASGALNDTWFNTGTSTLYQYDGSNWIVNANATLGTVYLEVFRMPVLDAITTGYAFEIAEEHHRKLIHWVLHEAYMKKDSDNIDAESYDPQRAQLELIKFNEYFGLPVSAAVRQNQLQEPRSAVIRPVDYSSKRYVDDWN